MKTSWVGVDTERYIKTIVIAKLVLRRGTVPPPALTAPTTAHPLAGMNRPAGSRSITSYCRAAAADSRTSAPIAPYGRYACLFGRATEESARPLACHDIGTPEVLAVRRRAADTLTEARGTLEDGSGASSLALCIPGVPS
ncbi:hypothetical protein PUR34_07935 [Streptomyces sp. JV185]|uniref:hypothetical protein n=1 Tax=Streptomyces sp. JV185 TaxID=858638 RepID=UPI002E77B195|nr:hypothetical protein [Streptomyces sp. JV185]MEE1768115.1 hypothetical protein [Streptomyces sp. JV185]